VPTSPTTVPIVDPTQPVDIPTTSSVMVSPIAAL
jgi:hypothetical protein